MKRVMAFLIIIGFLSGIPPAPESVAAVEKEFVAGTVLVSVELPDELMELGSRRLESRIKSIIPSDFSVEEIKDGEAILSGPRSQLAELERSGLEVDKIEYISGRGRQTGRLSRGADLAYRLNWGPLVYPGEIITDIDVDTKDNEDSVYIGTRNTGWTQGKMYYYDYQGNLIWFDSFSRGVDEVDEVRLDLAGNEGIYAVTMNSTNTTGGVYVYSRAGALLGSWASAVCGIDDVDAEDLDDDGSEELIVEPEDHNTFYVLDHNGNLAWSRTVTDDIASIYYRDLYDNDQYELIVFSRNTSLKRGQISVFSPAGALLGSHNFTSADLSGSYAPSYAECQDLDGDGIDEIIPDPWSLNEKIMILSPTGAVLATENLGRDLWDYSTSYDFNGDGNNDIALLTSDWSPEVCQARGYIGFNGSGFDSSWRYPPVHPIGKRPGEWGLDVERIVFGTEDTNTFTGCRIYSLNASDGTAWAPSAVVPGSVDDLEYRDLNNDGNKEIAILASTYSDPTHTWTFYGYDQDLNLLVPSGHFAFQSDTGSEGSYCPFVAVDLGDDDLYELIPTNERYLGNMAPVAAYTGVLKWSYTAPGSIKAIDYYNDVDGDGNDDLGINSVPGGKGHIAFLKDAGTSYGLIGSQTFDDEIDYISYRYLDYRPGCEILPRFENSLELSLYSFNLSHCFWSYTPSGDDIDELSDTDIDENDVNDIYLASNDTSTPTGYGYVFFGYSLPNNPVISSGDYNGDGTSDIAVFRGSSGLWAVRGVTRVYFGGSSDIPVPGDYSGDGTSDIGIFRGSSGLWAIRGVTRSYFGSVSDTTVSGDYDGNGQCDIGIFRESAGLWAIRGITRAYFGTTSDAVVPGDYDGNGTDDIGIFRGSSGLWAIRGISRVYFGGELDAPVPGDYSGNGADDIGIFRESAGLWAINGVTRAYFGTTEDTVVPADYTGNNADDIGIFRGISGLWAIRNISRAYFGSANDIPVAR